MARAPSIIVAVVGLAGAAGLAALAFTRKPVEGKNRPALEAVARDLDGKLRETRAGLRSRASTLADLQVLKDAVASDLLTVQDMASRELSFRTRPGETIEIAQVEVGGRVMPPPIAFPMTTTSGESRSRWVIPPGPAEKVCVSSMMSRVPCRRVTSRTASR